MLLITIIKNESDDGYKEFWKTYLYYCFTSEEIVQAEKMILPYLVYNHRSYSYICKNFYPTYTSNWVPQKLPTMTISSEFDYITPPDLFMSDPRYQRDTIYNIILKDVGHFPWLKGKTPLNHAFKTFQEEYLGI